MEEPNEKWEIEEYESERNKEGRVGWILNKGLGLGKKVLVAGVLISSAPLVLPPLLIVSALGFAVSVPSGVFLASYACAEKLMSKLLPSPAPLQLEYGTANGDGCLVGGIGMQKEEEEQLQDLKGGIELSVNKNNEIEEWNPRNEEDDEQEIVEMNEEANAECFDDDTMDWGYIWKKGVKMNEIEDIGDGDDLMEIVGEESNEKEGRRIERGGYSDAQEEEVGNLDVISEETGYEEDASEYLDLGVINKVRIEGDSEEYEEETEKGNEEPTEVHGVVLELTEGDEENEGATIEVTTVLVDENGDQGSANDIEEEELAKETTGFLERIRDEGKDDDPVKKEKQDVEKVGVVEESRDEMLATEDEESVGDKTVGGDVGLGKRSGTTEGEEAHRNIMEVPNEGQEMQKMKYNEDEKDVTRDASKEEEQTPVVNSSSTLLTGKAEKNVDDANTSKKKKKETVAPANADSREITGKSELDDQNIANGQYSYAVNENCKDSVDHAASLGKEEPKDAGISSSTEVPAPSHELQVVYDEEKIWEQIKAMRSIVGYKAAPHKTCIEELKALYVFTGVEPPASFKDPSDLLEVNIKLRFLMSIIGLK